MKRVLALALAALCLMSACAAGDASDGQSQDFPADVPGAVAPAPSEEAPAAPEQTPSAVDKLPAAAAVITGTLVQCSDSSLLLAGETAGALYTVSLDLPVYDETGARVETQAQPGQTVEIGYGGSVMETYPAQLGEAVYLRLLSEPDDRVGLYLTALDELWGKDPALNEGLTYLAFDLTRADNLSEGEKDALIWLASSAYALEPLTGTFDELCEQGLINREQLDFADGLLIELDVTEHSDDACTFTLTKWRGGLAAYILYDCEAQLENGAWHYELGAEMVS